jgi:predicted nucleic acid-binding Zn ribbon protein
VEEEAPQITTQQPGEIRRHRRRKRAKILLWVLVVALLMAGLILPHMDSTVAYAIASLLFYALVLVGAYLLVG